MGPLEARPALVTRFGAVPYACGLTLPADRLTEALRALRDIHGYRYYVCATATERATSIELVHGVRDPATHDTLFVRIELAADRPTADSAALIYAGAEWHERELYDLFGIVFRNHPDLTRLLLPDDYVGHPLRKGFAMDAPWGYRPATREPPGAA